MTPLTKTVRRVTLETYGYGRNARKLVVALERHLQLSAFRLRLSSMKETTEARFATGRA